MFSCFFLFRNFFFTFQSHPPSVALLKCPQLRGLPVVVAHGDSGGHSEISCASYEARSSGVRASMFVGTAKELCPSLLVLPYDFDALAAASAALLSALVATSDALDVLSVDEALLDVTGLVPPAPAVHPPCELDPAVAFAEALRARVEAATRGCRCSIGIGPNRLLARIATSRAKPDGVYRVTSAQAEAFLAPLPAKALPGVGRSTAAILAGLDLTTVADVAAAPVSTLTAAIGAVAGLKLAVRFFLFFSSCQQTSPHSPPRVLCFAGCCAGRGRHARRAARGRRVPPGVALHGMQLRCALRNAAGGQRVCGPARGVRRRVRLCC